MTAPDLVRELRHPYPKMRAHVVDGPAGVVALTWLFEHRAKDVLAITDQLVFDGKYFASDLGLHWRTPMYEWHTEEPSNDFCEYTQGPCWYDGTSLGARSAAQIFFAQGEDALYDELTEWYLSRTKEKA